MYSWNPFFMFSYSYPETILVLIFLFWHTIIYLFKHKKWERATLVSWVGEFAGGVYHTQKKESLGSIHVGYVLKSNTVIGVLDQKVVR